MEKRPKLVILQAKKPVNLQLFFTVYDFTEAIYTLWTKRMRGENAVLGARKISPICICTLTDLYFGIKEWRRERRLILVFISIIVSCILLVDTGFC